MLCCESDVSHQCILLELIYKGILERGLYYGSSKYLNMKKGLSHCEGDWKQLFVEFPFQLLKSQEHGPEHAAKSIGGFS